LTGSELFGTLYTINGILYQLGRLAMISPLRFEIHRYGILRQKLLEAFPETDDETIRDTLEGITTLDELIAEIVRSALID
jgi:hypothetical protein